MMRRESIGKFHLNQVEGVFTVGSDSLALGRFATVRPGFRVCDLGTGSGLLLLLLADREQTISVTGIELDVTSAAMAQRNMEENGLTASILEGDFRSLTLEAGRYDLVISNPPYFAINSGKVKNSARSEVTCTLEELCATAARLLKNGGRFALVHRPERLVDIFSTMRQVGIEPKRMKFLAHSSKHPPSAVLVEGVRQGRPGLAVEV